MRDAWLSYLAALAAPMGGLAALTAGCPECEPADQWPIERIQWYALLLVDVWYLSWFVGGVFPTITSGYRCGPCNARRDGAPRSRHLAGTAGGEPYVALDVQWPAGRIDNIIASLAAMPQWLRAYTRTDVGRGIIAYRGRRRLHVDMRTRDYIDNQT